MPLSNGGRRVRRDRAELGIATGIVGRSKGSSFFIWLIVGSVLPMFGLIAAFAYRGEDVEPERRCPRCNATLKLHVQVCTRLRARPGDAGGLGNSPGPRVPVT